MNKFRMLIMEDNETWVRRFRGSLEALGAGKLGGAQDAILAIDRAACQEEADGLVACSLPRGYDVVVLDLHYPVKIGEEPSNELTGGFQGMKWLPAIRILQPHAAIVVLTAHAYDDGLCNAMAAVRDFHANDFVPKDADIEHIAWRIARACQNARRMHDLMTYEKSYEELVTSFGMRVFAEDASSLVRKAKTDLLHIARKIRSEDPSVIRSTPAEIRAAVDELERKFVEVTQTFVPRKDPCHENDVWGILQELEVLYRRRIEDIGARYVNVGSENRLAIRTYENDLKVALLEVISNAIEALAQSKHTPQGTGEISVTVERVGGDVLIKIADNGDGFSDEILGHQFEAGNSFGKDKQQHQGIGLYVAWRVIRRLGGQIEADNRPEGGAEVRLTVGDLPARRSSSE